MENHKTADVTDNVEGEAARKDYSTPQLTEYGDIRQLTLHKSSGSMGDGGFFPFPRRTN